MVSASRSPILAGLFYGALIGAANWYFLGGSLWLRVITTVLVATAIGVIAKAGRRFDA